VASTMLTGNDFDDDGLDQFQSGPSSATDQQQQTNGSDNAQQQPEEEVITFEHGNLSIVGKDIQDLPYDLGQTYGPKTTTLNLSFNRITYDLQPTQARIIIIVVVFVAQPPSLIRTCLLINHHNLLTECLVCNVLSYCRWLVDCLTG
jgi:hypothetical protein